ncbi:MAG TPA: ThuA domain-containing protein [Chthonomonadaceae bacterium]|nr:ThuA domain-containing protein [Chthonomonadaceae bacterium]
MGEQISRRALLGSGLAWAGGLLLGERAGAPRGTARSQSKRRVVVWSEATAPRNVYPRDVNTAIAEGLKPLKGWEIVTASLDEPDQGLPDTLLNSASVLIWWGHQRHDEVKDALVARIVHRVKAEGMGFIATHSAHWSKPFKALMGTSGSWNGGYVEDGSRLNVIVRAPRHPIARGIRDFVVPHTERYTEPFDVPTPETLVFDGIYTRPDGSTEHSRQGLTWTVEKGRVFYFQPGHESYPIYFQEEVRHVFRNAVAWAAPTKQ